MSASDGLAAATSVASAMTPAIEVSTSEARLRAARSRMSALEAAAWGAGRRSWQRRIRGQDKKQRRRRDEFLPPPIALREGICDHRLMPLDPFPTEILTAEEMA